MKRHLRSTPAAPAVQPGCHLFGIVVAQLLCCLFHLLHKAGANHWGFALDVLTQLIVSQINPVALLPAAYFGLLCSHPQGRCRGKRVGVFGAFLLAIYNEETEEYQTISKIGTGFSEEQLKDLADLLRPLTISDPRTYYRLVTISQPRSYHRLVTISQLRSWYRLVT